MLQVFPGAPGTCGLPQRALLVSWLFFCVFSKALPCDCLILLGIRVALGTLDGHVLVYWSLKYLQAHSQLLLSFPSFITI